MAKYINVEELLEEVREDYKNDTNIYHSETERVVHNVTYEFAIDTIESATCLVDTVEIVRCKDCKYFKSRSRKNNYGLCDCSEKQTNANAEFYPFADDFCSYGIKAED